MKYHLKCRNCPNIVSSNDRSKLLDNFNNRCIMCNSDELYITEDSAVDSPKHYNLGKIEAIDYIEDQGMGKGFVLGNAIKYIVRAGAKGNEVEDLNKAIWYLNRRIKQIEEST